MNTPTDPTPTPPERGIIPLSARATSARLRISASPTRSVRPTAAIVKEPDGTSWDVISLTVDDEYICPYGDPPYPECRGNCWIDLEVKCPHDRPPTEDRPIELRGVLLCVPIDGLPVSAGDTERDRRWARDASKPRGGQRTPSGEWDLTYRGDFSPIASATPANEEAPRLQLDLLMFGQDSGQVHFELRHDGSPARITVDHANVPSLLAIVLNALRVGGYSPDVLDAAAKSCVAAFPSRLAVLL